MATDAREAPAQEEYNYPAFARSTAVGMAATFRGSVRVGEAAPDFALLGLDGTVTRLSDLRGKYVVLEFGSIT
jgi:hypothetical protein